VDQLEVMSAALDALSHRWGERFTVIEVPDEIEREAPAVDLLVEGEKGEMVIEHTVVESFHKRIFDDRLFVALAAEIERRWSTSCLSRAITGLCFSLVKYDAGRTSMA
jgi:hypothetical protein